MIQTEGFTVIDGTYGIEEQQRLVRNTVSKILPPKQLSAKSYADM
jgi:hypothetical protein